MGKKIILGICGAVFALGLFCFAGGHVLGGRSGSITARDGWLVYVTAEETIPLTELPSGWWSDSDFTLFGITFQNGNIGGHVASSRLMEETRQETTVATLDDFPAAGNIAPLSISVDIGYVHLVPGDEWGVTVDGPMEYYSYNDGGYWYFSAGEGYNGITTREVDGRAHYFYQGVDITTDFTFTVPEDAYTIELYSAVGGVSVGGITVDTISIYSDVSYIEIDGLTASRAQLQTEVGALNAINLDVEDLDIYSEVGTASLQGTVHDRLSIYTEIGLVEATLTRPADYGYTAYGSLSNIRIGGQRVTGLLGGTNSFNMEADLIFELTCELGSIDIHFE